MIEELIERVKLTDKEIEEKYNCTKTRNASHYALVKSIAETAINKVLNDPDFALIIRDWQGSYPKGSENALVFPLREAIKNMASENTEGDEPMWEGLGVPYSPGDE